MIPKNNVNFENIIDIARKAGELIMGYYNKSYNINTKEDDSPVTEADIVANQYIVDSLKSLAISAPIIAEENLVIENSLANPQGQFWLIDPIDGTKGFIKKDNNFTVNIAFINNTKPVMGVVYAPATNELFYTDGEGKAYKIDRKGEIKLLNANKILDRALDVLVGSHPDHGIDELEKTYLINSVKYLGSSLKLCHIAEGLADAYPRRGLTMEWDTAAGHAILAAAGGEIVDSDNNTLSYGKQDFKNPAFIAFGSRL